MKKQFRPVRTFLLIIFVFLASRALLDFFTLYMRNPKFVVYRIQYFFYTLGDVSPIVWAVLLAVAASIVVWVCQRVEDKKLQSETDFIQAEHLCKSNDENMQDYADAAEKRVQKQQRLSTEIYGKRPPQSKYYKK